MTIWGKIVGGATGMALGGPLGALIGLVMGAALDVTVDKQAREGGENRVAFSIGVIALAAKMAKADGKVTREEVDAFKQVFRVPPEEMDNVGRVFDMARQHTAGYDAYARQLVKVTAGNKMLLRDLLEALFFIAKSDGEIHPAEKEFLQTVSHIFGFSDGEFDSIYQSHAGIDEKNPYHILGVSPDISDADLKAAYRKMVRDTHPDRLMAEGVPPDMIAVATRRAAEVNAAYDEIMQEREKSKVVV